MSWKESAGGAIVSVCERKDRVSECLGSPNSVCDNECERGHTAQGVKHAFAEAMTRSLKFMRWRAHGVRPEFWSKLKYTNNCVGHDVWPRHSRPLGG